MGNCYSEKPRYQKPDNDFIIDYSEFKGSFTGVNPDDVKEILVAKAGYGGQTAMTCMENLDAILNSKGNLLAIVAADGSKMTWAQYITKIKQASAAFVALGIEGRSCANILGFNSPEWHIANFGAMGAGCIPAGIYATNAADACQYISDHSKAPIVFVRGEAQLNKYLEIREALPTLKYIVMWDGEVPVDVKTQEGAAEVMSFDDFLAKGAAASEEEKKETKTRWDGTQAGECCTLIYTSGTTGRPKAVMMTHDNLCWMAGAAVGRLGMGSGGEERVISYLPLSHIAAQLADMHLPNHIASHTSNNMVCYFARPDALKGSLKTTLAAVRPTLFFGVPRVWEKFSAAIIEKGKDTPPGAKKNLIAWAKAKGIADYKGNEEGEQEGTPWGYGLASKLVHSKVKVALGLDACKACVVGAAPIQRETLEFFGSLGINILNVYGMSESTGVITANAHSHYKIGAAGFPLEGSECRIDHVEGRDKPEEGEICYRGRQIMLGYMYEAKKTAEAIDEEGWLHSGDVGRLDEDGFLWITGRIKELIIGAGGENVAPVPIEEALKKNLPAVSNVMMIGDKRKFMSILITLKCKVDEEGVPLPELDGPALEVSEAKTVSEAQKDPKWAEYIQAGIDATNNSPAVVSRAARLSKWVILDRDFSIPGGELGPTLKLKRPAVDEIHKKTIDALYE